ncbi:hypothetical protein LCGC14_1377200 [marine sediment metagenome]|uniref:Uncharacterized protein n=1 Tax=marine sediment metagenome TaxID=412755 RepID=A0A0F9MJ02_9ZZZZ
MTPFEDLTIAQLRKLTEEFERLKIENVKLKVKYTNKILPEIKTAQELLDEINNNGGIK